MSWALESAGRGQRQNAFRVLVSSSPELLETEAGDLWDTGRIDSNQTLNLEYGGLPLTSGERCFWKVMAWDRDGKPSPWSRAAWWEMALLEGRDWTGQWIGDDKPDPTRDEDFYGEDPAPLFRKTFPLERSVRRARLYISGLGYYEAYLNDERVGDHMLDPRALLWGDGNLFLLIRPVALSGLRSMLHPLTQGLRPGLFASAPSGRKKLGSSAPRLLFG